MKIIKKPVVNRPAEPMHKDNCCNQRAINN